MISLPSSQLSFISIYSFVRSVCQIINGSSMSSCFMKVYVVVFNIFSSEDYSHLAKTSLELEMFVIIK